MSSACANPFLYGWFNDNFRSEFKLIFAIPYRALFPPRTAAGIYQRRHDNRNSPATAFNSVLDSMSTLGQSSRLRRAATTHQSAIDTSIHEKNKILGKNSTIGLGHPTSTTKEMLLMVDRRNVVETKLISPSISSASPVEEETNNIDSDEIHDNILLAQPNLSSVLESSSTLETHL